MRDKTNAELAYIIRDAGEAAENMRGHNYAAECKYLDQVNDACTELARRRTAMGRVARDEAIQDASVMADSREYWKKLAGDYMGSTQRLGSELSQVRAELAALKAHV